MVVEEGLYMVIFDYFFSIGTGLALGIAIVAIPSFAYYPRIADRLQRGLFKRRNVR